MWPFAKKTQPVAINLPKGIFSTHSRDHELGPQVENRAPLVIDLPQPSGALAMDSEMSGEVVHERWPLKGIQAGVPDALMSWYASQSFIGYQACALLAQQWLISKAIWMPAKDAVRMGWEVECSDERAAEVIRASDKRMKIKNVLKEYCAMARTYGIRVALYEVDSTDPEFYEKPFNPDGVTVGSYRGISQIDPVWCYPEPTQANLTNPASGDFYEPTFWIIGSKRYHKSHLCIYVPYPVADPLKPMYRFGGVSLPQRMYERVYASERTANEAPILAMTKRLQTFQAAEGANLEEVRQNMGVMTEFRDNHGVLVHGPNEAYGQTDTSLADLDAVIMTQFQLDAAIAEVPATKLLGTSPKGFGAAGDYELESYRETLEGVQSDAYEPLLDGHYVRLMRSVVAPKLSIEPEEVRVQWAALDSPTAAEFAAIELQKAQAAQAYSAIGAIDGEDVRKQLKGDKDSPWFGLEDREILAPEEEEALYGNPFNG